MSKMTFNDIYDGNKVSSDDIELWLTGYQIHELYFFSHDIYY